MALFAPDPKSSSTQPAPPMERLERWRQEQQQQASAQTPPVDSDERGPTLGRELPFGVYLSVVGAYVWLVIVSWVAFAKGADVDINLGIVVVIFLLLLGLPTIAFHLAWSHQKGSAAPGRDFSWSKIDTATGALSGNEAWVQILIIPGALALAATMIGLVYWIEI